MVLAIAGRAPDPPLPDGIKRNWTFSVNIVMGYFAAIQPLTELIYTGLFERFSELKFVHAEVDFGWVPFWVGRKSPLNQSTKCLPPTWMLLLRTLSAVLWRNAPMATVPDPIL